MDFHQFRAYTTNGKVRERKVIVALLRPSPRDRVGYFCNEAKKSPHNIIQDRELGTPKSAVARLPTTKNGGAQKTAMFGQKTGIRRVGSSVVLVPVRVMAQELGLSARNLQRTLAALQIPTTRVDGAEVFNLYSLELCLFEALLPGNPSFTLGKQMPWLTHDEEVRAEMGTASLMYAGANRAALVARLKELRKVIRQESRTKTK